MQGSADRQARALVWRCFLIALLLLLSANSCGDGANVPSRTIPGTEQVTVGEFTISVSPDEKWLAFTEWVSPDRTMNLPAGDYWFRVTTLNLQTGEAVHHEIESIPAQALGLSSGDRGWKAVAGLEIVNRRFRPPGWIGDHFYFQPYFDGVQVGIDPITPGMQIVAKPDTPGICSDCPPLTTVEFMGKSWDLLSNRVSAVMRDGIVAAIYYVDSPLHPEQNDLRTIYEARDKAERPVVHVPSKAPVMNLVSCVRVSPDARLLAYVVDSKKPDLFAGPRDALFIRDLTSGHERKVAEYMYVSNLSWSRDGRRLYFASGEYDSDGGVRIVDVAATPGQD
jgi:hypothetical protein